MGKKNPVLPRKVERAPYLFLRKKKEVILHVVWLFPWLVKKLRTDQTTRLSLGNREGGCLPLERKNRAEGNTVHDWFLWIRREKEKWKGHPIRRKLRDGTTRHRAGISRPGVTGFLALDTFLRAQRGRGFLNPKVRKEILVNEKHKQPCS